MDAVTHCVETYLSPRDNPPAEAIALDGLKRAVEQHREGRRRRLRSRARYQMMMAALEGGLTFQKGLGAVHALSHPLGGRKDLSLHHGTLNAVILPAVLRFNQGHRRAEIRWSSAKALGLAGGARAWRIWIAEPDRAARQCPTNAGRDGRAARSASRRLRRARPRITPRRPIPVRPARRITGRSSKRPMRASLSG